MNFLTPSTNWNNLPIEVKLVVIKHLELSSRLALRSCSSKDFQLVESVAFRKIHEIQLRIFGNNISIISYENYYSPMNVLKFESFDEFQKKVISLFDTLDYIEQLTISVEDSTNIIKLESRNGKIKVGRLIIPKYNTLALLQQVDASVLKGLNIQDKGIEINPELYDLPQVKSIEDLRLNRGLIQDHQLMELKLRTFYIISPKSLTSSGICNFIRKCAANPNFEKLEFLWLGIEQFKEIYKELFTSSDLESEEFTVNPSFPEFEIRLRKADNMIVMRRMKIGPTDAPLKLRKINDMIIEAHRGRYKLAISEKYEDEVEWYFESPDELQECLTIKMKSINYIKRLKITLEEETHDGGSIWRFIPPGSSKQITVGHIKLSRCEKINGQAIVEMLEQIEPGHLKCFSSNGEMICHRVYDTQQVIQANFIDSTQSDVRDDQLLKLNAETLHFKIERDEIDIVEILSPSGTNKFIKKRLLDLKNKNCDFKLILGTNWSEYGEFISKLLEGLDVFSMKTEQKIGEEFFPSEVVVNSQWDNIKLELMIDEAYINGTRIEV